jgi:hypothetical protein
MGQQVKALEKHEVPERVKDKESNTRFIRISRDLRFHFRSGNRSNNPMGQLSLRFSAGYSRTVKHRNRRRLRSPHPIDSNGIFAVKDGKYMF